MSRFLFSSAFSFIAQLVDWFIHNEPASQRVGEKRVLVHVITDGARFSNLGKDREIHVTVSNKDVHLAFYLDGVWHVDLDIFVTTADINQIGKAVVDFFNQPEVAQ